MRAGPLRHHCSVQALQEISDGYGGYSEGWTETRKVWAEITMPTGRTSVVAQQITALVTAEIRVRPAADLVVGVRIVHGADRYLVEAALLDNENSMLRLLCSLVKAQEA
ncbi:phage head closure protein [Pseudomonas fluorescens]|uniref:Phage head-tail joining protein n=1 Tax=Pseudomonas fluorescens TaxID=294 RepID=A0A109KN35_PSEFL|nr:phage head closure protein [Pseudomonas fluorescens]KWV72171.1 Phage head-tail joining protein [Pseudomonas fluorescens]